MKRIIKIEKEVDIKTLEVNAGVRYWEDARVNGIEDEEGELIPCRDGDGWKPVIDIDKGLITNWKIGVVADIHYKVCDAGIYTLKDSEGNVIAVHDGYVRDILCPVGDGFGDYIIMKVDEKGQIQDWRPDLDDFFEGED